MKINLQLKLLIVSVVALAVLGGLQLDGVARIPLEAYFGLTLFSIFVFNRVAFNGQ